MTRQAPAAISEQSVQIPCQSRRLPGILRIPAVAQGAVIFAHGSGSGRFSPRNQFVARQLNEAGLATLLLDLLDEAEAEDRDKVFDIDLLARRLEGAANWLASREEVRGLRIGFFGASTGAAAALEAAARIPDEIGAVVSRGGRPDLAMGSLRLVGAPTLLIVGGDDDVVLALNEEAYHHLRCPKRIDVIPGATHLFPEPGALEEVARRARDWFLNYLSPDGGPGPQKPR